MVSASTKITAPFVVLGVLLWYLSLLVTDRTVVQLAVLLVVGIILPTVINEWRQRQATEQK